MEKFVNYSKIEDCERDAMRALKIPFSKFRSQLSSQVRKDSKIEKCLYCGHETSKLCNSHTLPAFVLKNIALDGKLYSTNKVLGFPLLEEESGINSSGTFRLICRKCDSKIFADYENPESYNSEPTLLMVTQMAIKNYLRQIGKRRYELSLYTELQNQFCADFEQHRNVSDIDLKDYLNGYRKAKKALTKSWGDEFFLFFYEKLNYVVPVASQVLLNPLVGLSGERINDVFNMSRNYKIQPLHVSIFPLKNNSIVMLFLEKDSNRYRQFRKDFGKLSPEDKLTAINYLVLSLSEEVFLSKKISDAVLKDEELQKVIGQPPAYLGDSPVPNNDFIKNNFCFSKMYSIPNLLTSTVYAKQN